LTGGTAAPGDPYWLETINHQGTSAFNPDPSSYKVFRNVKDFGAKGDGVTDDTAAIMHVTLLMPNRRLTDISGRPCLLVDVAVADLVNLLRQCRTLLAGTYIDPQPLALLQPSCISLQGLFVFVLIMRSTVYIRQDLHRLFGNSDVLLHSDDWRCEKSSNSPCQFIIQWICSHRYFSCHFIYEIGSIFCLDADPYIPNGWGAQWFTNQNNLCAVFQRLLHCSSFTSSYRSVRNLIIDLRQIPAANAAIGLHWQVAQATSLINIVVEMSIESGNNHQGMFMENGR